MDGAQDNALKTSLKKAIDAKMAIKGPSRLGQHFSLRVPTATAHGM